MSILPTSNIRRYDDVEEEVNISVSLPLFTTDTLAVYYGEAGLDAIENVDYEIILNETDYSSFTFRPLESLITKIDAQIVADPTDRNTVLLVRILPAETDATPAGVRSTQFVSKEFDRIAMRFQQVDEQISRAVLLSLFDEQTYLSLDLPPWAAGEYIVWHPTLKKLISTPASVPSALIDTDPTLAANSDLFVPSQKAAKTYIDAGDAVLDGRLDLVEDELDTKLPLSGSVPMTGPIRFTHQTSPANPAAGLLALFAKSDNKLYTRTSAGVEVALGSGDFQIAATRAALKAIDTALYANALLTESGRDGVFVFRAGDYSARVAADVLEGVYVKATAIAAASGAWVRQGEWAITGVNPTWFGAAGDNVTDDSAAFQAAVNLAGNVTVPPGTFYLGNTNITIETRATRLRGSGIGVTVLRWDGAAGGITVQPDSDLFCEIAAISLHQSGQAVGTAIKYDGTGQVSGGAIAQRTTPRLSLHQIKIQGSTASNVDGWDCHVHLLDAMHVTIDGVHMVGHYGVGGQYEPESTYGIRIQETPDVGSVEFTITNCWAFWVVGALHLDGCEGVFVDHCNFVNVTNGINATSVLQLSVNNSHINSVGTGIIGGITQSFITGCLFYGVATGSDPITFIAIANSRSFNAIVGNTFIGVTGRVDTAVSIGASSANNIVSENVFRSMDVGIENNGSTTLIGPNTYSSVTSEVTGTGTFQSWNAYAASIELNGGAAVNPYIDFKNALADDADCRIQQSLNGLLFSTGGQGSMTLRMSLLTSGMLDLDYPLGRGAAVTKTADFTVAATENWLINNKSGSTCTVTLPTASSWPGRELMIKTIQAQTTVSASANVVPLGGGAAGTAILSANAGRWATLVSNGTNWEIMAGVV